MPVSDKSSLSDNLAAARAALVDRPDVTVGGDCGVEVAPIEAALAAHGDGLVVVWFDAHGDLNTPESSPSGAFHGMVLRTLLGSDFPEILPLRTLRPDQVVLAGVRALDPAEKEYVEEAGLAHVEPAALGTLTSVVAGLDAQAVYLHIDLDVLDPSLFAAVGTPEPEGVTPDQLIAAVRELTARFPIAGVGITEYEPDRPEDRAVLARLVPALFSDEPSR